MISLLNFIDTGFIITLGLLLLVSGLVMLYCYRRLNILENSVIEHGKILQNFIVNYNNQIIAGNVNGGNNVNNLYHASNSHVIQDTENMNNDESNKIAVSDDENDVNEEDDENDVNEEDDDDDNDDDDDDDDDEDDDDEDDDDDDEDNDDDEHAISKIESSIKQIDLVDDHNIYKLDIELDINSLDLSNMHAKSKLINILDNNTNDNDNQNDNEIEKPSEHKKNFSKMKVDELRSLVVTNNIMNNDEALLVKKNDLIKLLQQ